MIETSHGQWAITPGSAGWIPAGLAHSAWMPVDATGACLHFVAQECGAFPASSGLWAASTFLLQLLEHIALHYEAGGEPRRLEHLLLVLADEIQEASPIPARLSLPEDRRARAVAQRILSDGASHLSQQELAQREGLSTRTLSRLFRQQTGQTFSHWRQHAKVILALEHLLRGEPVSQVAASCGYENVSAFIAAFRRFMGVTPGQFQNDNSAQHPEAEPL